MALAPSPVPATVPTAGSAASALPLATPEQRAKIKGAAEAFEAQMLSVMMQPMFAGLTTAAPFGGGEAEQTYRSFLLDAFAKQTVKAGGVGLAQPVMREMLKLQGLQ